MNTAVAPYLKKDVELRVGRATLQLRTAHGLFSSHTVDAGTALLLRTLTDLPPPAAVLDVGCGYGPLGLGLKAVYPAARVHMVDRDALAVAVAALNASDTDDGGVHCYGSLAYDAIDPGLRFDLVVSNLPGKAGLPVIEELLVGAGAVLEPDGIAAVVVVAALADEVGGVLERARASILLRKDSKAYAVFHYRPPRLEAPRRAFDGGVFVRDRREFSRAGIQWQASTVWGLPEFDSLGFDTMLMVDLLVNAHLSGVRALLVEPGQGHLALAAASAVDPATMTLIGRDLLALNASRSNLMAGGVDAGVVECRHALGLEAGASSFDLAMVSLADKLPIECSTAAVRSAAAHTVPGGTVIVGGRSTTITRLLDALSGFEVRERSRRHGFSAVRLRTPAMSADRTEPG